MWSRKAKLLSLLALGTLIAGGWANSPRMELLGFTLLSLLLVEWLRFRLGRLHPGLVLEREFSGLSRAGCCWLDDEIKITVRLKSSRSWPHVEARDVVPPHFKFKSSPPSWQGSLGEASWSYAVTAGRVGQARFPGISCTLISWGGLFFDTIFVESARTVPIYPEVFHKQTSPAFRKRYNLFRMHGIHVHRRPGTGSELLQLRDYVPGDPPQTIAWRASARREHIVTRDFESEVPIRVTLFLDASASNRIGGAEGTQLDSAIALMAQFAKLALDSRDWVGLVTFTETQESIVRPARGRTHLFRILETLTSYGNVSPGHSLGDFEGLFDTVERYCRIRYPRAWTRTVNHYPFPFFTFELGRGLKRQARHKKVAAILTALFELGPACLERAIWDQAYFAGLLAKFCERESLWVGRGFSESALEVCRESAPKTAVLERSLRYTLRRAKDNELYVILANFAMLEDRLDSIIGTARLAAARHHRVMIVNPWLSEYFGTETSRPAWDPRDPSKTLDALARDRYVQSQEKVKKAFLEAGIPYVVLHPEDTVAFLLAHVDRLRQHHGVPA